MNIRWKSISNQQDQIISYIIAVLLNIVIETSLIHMAIATSLSINTWFNSLPPI